MKKSVKLIALAAAVGVAAGAYAAVSRLNSGDEAPDENVTIAAHFDEDINALSWKTEEAQFSITKNKNGIWHLDSDKDFPLDNDYVHSVIEKISSIEAIRVVNEAPESKDDYGLDKPSLSVTIGSSSSSTVLDFGDVSGQGNYFVSGQSSTVYLVDTSVADKFTSDIYSLVDIQDVPDLYNLKKIEITAKDSVTVINSASDGNLSVVIDGKSKKLEQTQSSGITQAVLAISPEKCVNYKGEFKKYGLDNPEYIIAVTYMAKSEDEADIESVFTLNVGNSDDDGCRYVNFERSPLIYTINEEAIKALFITDTNSLISED